MSEYDIVKMQGLLKVNVLEFLTHLQFMKQKGEIEIFEASIKK